jgi:microcystin-dependent protein
MEPLIGQIIMFGGNFAPRGWAFCDGQSLKIAEHEALFAILGTTYGGDGRTDFCLPDMRGRVPMHSGQGDELTPRDLGQKLGAENVALSASQLPEHRHEMLVSDAQPDGESPANSAIAAANIYVTSDEGTHRQRSAPKTPLNSKTIGLTGGSAPHENMQPTLCVNYIIAVQGSFPSRN